MQSTRIKDTASETFPSYRCFSLDACGGLRVIRQGSTLTASDERGNWMTVAAHANDLTEPRADSKLSTEDHTRLLSALLGFVFSMEPDCLAVHLSGEGWEPFIGGLCAIGGHFDAAGPSVRADMFWQAARLWSPTQAVPYPRHDVYDGRTFHPLRPPKPSGRVYARFIPWLGGELTLDVATLGDLPDVHRWMNQPRVNEFWQEAGDELRHRRYLEGMFADPHIIPLIARFEGRSFGYFEVYWAKEDLIGPFCAAGDYDRGCHVIIGEEACRGRAWFTAWLPSLLHFMFLDDPRTERIVQEPQADHHRQLRNLQRSGFSRTGTVELPNKRAAIVEISRRKFFSDRLWHPVDDERKTN
ncbi:GNAT family N-acetyltransferase [Rhizobium sp. Rhizsp42]|uniref:GNAT family N-acetyltransferase n=1 Tax=Rhizobium sp. Rhizsp42 TaxID=3243034 RepID=UPI0039AF0DBB